MEVTEMFKGLKGDAKFLERLAVRILALIDEEKVKMIKTLMTSLDGDDMELWVETIGLAFLNLHHFLTSTQLKAMN